MRHVPYDATKINYPPGWAERADTARRAVAAAKAENRAAEIAKYDDVWKALKPELRKIVGNKCWYTEAPLAGADADIDHFRPKNSVRGVHKPGTNEAHPGYWWLAFDPRNYRYSCIVANRLRRDGETRELGGKGDEFPIWDESKRSWSENDGYEDEQPLLIDPCNAFDVTLIMFATNGQPFPRYSESDKPRQFVRAEISIRAYHLKDTGLVNARIDIRDKLQRHIEDAKRYYARLENGDATIEHAYRRAIECIREACSIYAPYSGFARAMLEPYKTEECLTGVFW